MSNEFTIKLDDKPGLSKLMTENEGAFVEILQTFVGLAETAAQKEWYQLPEQIHTSLSFKDVVTGILDSVMTTYEIDKEGHAALGYDLHPLALLSDKRKNIITGEQEVYDWKSHFILDDNEVSKETIERLIRKMLYLMRWFDVETVSKALLAREFPVMDSKDIEKLPFQPALKYQKEHLGDLWLGKFHHEVGALNGGEIDKDVENCPACQIGDLYNVNGILVCPRCNIGFSLKKEFTF